MDINAYPGCSKVIDPDTVPASSRTPDMTMDPVSAEASQNKMDLWRHFLLMQTSSQMVTQPPGVFRILGGQSNHGHQHRLPQLCQSLGRRHGLWQDTSQWPQVPSKLSMSAGSSLPLTLQICLYHQHLPRSPPSLSHFSTTR